jgi:predicted DsbA family dithiol-disulfide isomerase
VRDGDPRPVEHPLGDPVVPRGVAQGVFPGGDLRHVHDRLDPGLLGCLGKVGRRTWRPFRLNPTMPREGLDRRAYRSAKFGSWEKSQALDAQVTEAGASAGLVFRHDLMAKTPNTVASHALIRLARETGDAAMQDRVVEALFSAYFTRGLDVGDPAVLADLAEAAGIERSRASAFLSEPASFDAVIDDEKLARGLGLNGVPAFVLGGNYLFSGAQPTSVMVRALREASAKLISAGQVAAPAEPAHAPA